MKRLRALLCICVAAAGASVLAQGQQAQSPASPAADAPSGPAIDLSGYWTPTMNEDGMERGAGSELNDYGGFPLNEAGRLWALSYDPSRVTLRNHQCDARPGTSARGKNVIRTHSGSSPFTGGHR